MKPLLDSSVLIAALVPTEAGHQACATQLTQPGATVYVHALNEVFATLTGGTLGFRLDADIAAQLIRDKIIARMEVIVLTAEETAAAQQQARAHGVRGGAIYDFMHLIAARKARADTLLTLNLTDFLHLHREGDPDVRQP